MRLTSLPLFGALALVSPAFAITVNFTDFSFPAPPSVDAVDPLDGISYSGAAGRFTGSIEGATTLAAQTVGVIAAATAPRSFVAYCAELTQSFSFNTSYVEYSATDATGYFGAARSADLSRLFSAFASSVVDASTSAAMQAGIWEVIYEKGTRYSLSSGNFTLSSQDPSFARAFARMEGVLGSLQSYSPNVALGVLTSESHQDFLYVSTIPEPSTWALLAGGLALVGGAVVRRRRAGREAGNGSVETFAAG